jgi:hypothetical protein
MTTTASESDSPRDEQGQPCGHSGPVCPCVQTVLTIEPLDFNLLGNTMVRNFGGAITAGRRVVRVEYPASLDPRSIDRGVEALDQCLHTTPGRVLVFAHSQGAQVVSRWLRVHAADSGAPDPGRVSFLLIGNPLRKYGGAGIGQPEVDGSPGLPTPNDTRYRVTDVKLQYDGWADAPSMPGELADANARQDRFGINGKSAIHALGYRTADLDNPDRKTYAEGTTEYVMLPHKPLLPLVPEQWIEASYSRPEH